MPKNKDLNTAKDAKKDEFYTTGELKNVPLISPTEERVKEQLIKHKRQLEIIQNIDK